MNSFDMSSLNNEQQQALLQTEGPVLVTAGAGSGKTRLLTHRIAYLLSKGVSPYAILAITFTNKATREMSERVKKMCDFGDKIWISTFHSMCAKLLRQDIDKIGYTRSFSIYAEDDSEKVVKEILNEMSLSEDKWKKEIITHLSNWKNTILSLSEYELAMKDVTDIHKIIQIMNEYENRLRKNNALDFDDLLIKTYQLFVKREDIKNYYAQRFQYILVDEFQDTNTVQYELLKQLASVHGNIFVVGDEDQCIYSWRGANFKNIFKFKNDFPDVKIFKLERNYRSTGAILEKANKLISHNKSRLDKRLWTESPNGEEPVIYEATDERDEALFVAGTIEKLIRQGMSPSDFAVLMRLNALTRNIEEAFLAYNIPHKIYGGFKFYERAEIKMLTSYLRLFVNGDDDVALMRIINFPKRGIGDGTIAKLKTIAEQRSLLQTILEYDLDDSINKKLDDFKTNFQFLSELDLKPDDFVSEMIEKFHIKQAFDSKTEEGLNKIMNISAFEGAVKEFVKLNPDADLADFLESITLTSEADAIGEGGFVTISTIHAVKGLEFKNVFIIGLEEGIFPISRHNSFDDLEEERRLMYVAVTRAEKKLFLTHCSRRFLYGKTSYQIVSRFCRELGYYDFKPQKISTSGDALGQFSPKSSFNFNKNDVMLQRVEKANQNIDISIYKVGQKVSHPKFGEGEIENISDDGLVADIIFDGFGKKSLMLELAPLTIMEG